MKKKVIIGIIVVIVLALLSYIIPVKKVEGIIWVNDDGIADVGHYEELDVYYNMYNIQIWNFSK